MSTARLAKVQLEGADGLPLYVDVRSGGRPAERRPAVVICHGFKGFKDWGFFPRLADRLAAAGFMAVSFNFSGSGVADTDQFVELARWEHQKPTADLQDLTTVVNHVVDGGAPWVGLLGHSRGGALAMLHASRDPRVRALVTWAAIDHFLRFSEADLLRWRHEGRLEVTNTRTGQVLPIGLAALDDVERHQADLLDVAGAAGRLTQPWLIIHGTDDHTVPPSTAGRLREASRAPETRVAMIEGADHTFGIKHPWAGPTADYERVVAMTVAFLGEALGG